MWPVTRSTRSHGPGCQVQRVFRFSWQTVVDSESAPDGETAVGDVMRFAHGPLTLVRIDEEGTDLERRRFLVPGIAIGLGGSVGDLADGAEGDGVGLRRLGGFGLFGASARETRERKDDQQRHWSGAEGLHGGQGRRTAQGTQDENAWTVRGARTRRCLGQRLPDGNPGGISVVTGRVLHCSPGRPSCWQSSIVFSE